MNKTELFLQHIDEVAEKEISDSLRLRFKLGLLDYIGVTFAGVKANGAKLTALTDMAEEGQTPAIGIDKVMSMENTVYLNGLNGHTLDFDDGTNAGIIHLGSPLFSVLLPLAKKYNVPAERFIKAVILGYEASFTLAVTMQPLHKRMGFHATGVCGTLGIAIAVSEMLGYDKKQRKNALSAAAVAATGMLKVLDDGSDLKPFNVAKTALMGYTAAKMGKAGFNGPDDVFAGEIGFLQMMCGNENIEMKPMLLNGTYALEKAYIKPYAACRYCHPSIGAAINMHKQYNIVPADVDHIDIRTYNLAVKHHDHTTIAACGAAKMSIPYSVAVALTFGRAGMDEYTPEMIVRPDILELTKKVSVAEDDEMSANFPAKQTAVVKIYMKDGTVYTEQVDFPKGEPENPTSVEETREKYEPLTIYSGRTKEEADEIFEAVMDIENQFDKLLDIITGTKNH